MPSCQRTHGVLPEGLVVGNQSLEGLALPLVHPVVEGVGVGLLIGVVYEILLEIAVVLVVVDVRRAQLGRQSVQYLVVNAKEPREVGVLSVDPQVVVEPCYWAAVGDGSPRAVVIASCNPWRDEVELTYDLVGAATRVSR